ncbi:hypothetical protein LJB89_02965 [Tyzzerella sp. OttesenSCG-928-J15]|nr:hypothetical protein [Tyzzerella sp. OttesenSCG-928-J15]MDL2288004.1 hypothetical protein [Oscillospiraceae bacterium OttesenSCG-928-F05]
MSNERIEQILSNTKVSFAMEGLTIDDALEDKVRQILTGKLSLDVYISDCVKRAQEMSV